MPYSDTKQRPPFDCAFYLLQLMEYSHSCMNKESAHKFTQFNADKIEALESPNTAKETQGLSTLPKQRSVYSQKGA
jgi:hypothetical protein